MMNLLHTNYGTQTKASRYSASYLEDTVSVLLLRITTLLSNSRHLVFVIIKTRKIIMIIILCCI